MVDKGKGIADDSSGKRKRNGDDKSGNRKRKNNAVLQFFDDTAYEINESGSDEEDDFINDDINNILGPDPEVKTEPKTPNISFFPKEEEMDEEEMDKMMEARYKTGANSVRYAEDRPKAASMDDRNTHMPSVNDPTMWKVKCMVGRERHSVFCLMQKYVDLKSLGTKLQIVSAFAVEHVKGFIYIEAERQCDINEACKGLCNIYPARVAPVPPSDVQNLFSVRSKYSGVSVDTWARVKNGKYKGDLGQVVNVDESKRKATVKLVPRIDLQAVSEKFGGGVTGKKSTIPAPRLITSSELEAYRPLVQYRRDRDTGDMYEVFDGMLLKDGYLFKKVPLDSLSFWDVRPSEAELIKFSPAHKEESNDVEWLTGLFGERKKKKPTTSNNKGGKGEGSSSSGMDNDFEVDDPVFNGRKGFGVVVGREKDDRIKVLQEGSGKPMVVAVEARLLKKADFDKKFTAFDQHKKIISLNDTVRILEGPLEDKQGIVKQIYKGVIFLRDENESENCGYFCAKSQICEKMESSADLLKGKGGKSDASGFDDFPASPKSPLSPQKPFEGRENSRNFDRDNQDGLSVGQPCRIRVGPLKGYICRVMAIRYSDITVKLDSQHKILTVKSEHLAEVKDKSSSVSIGDGQESKPFELLGDHGSSEGWMDAGAASQSGGWNTGGHSTERSSWAPFPSAGSSIQESLDNDASNDGVGASAWEAKATQQSTPWGASASENKSGGWGASSSGVKIDNMDDAGWGGTSVKLKDSVDAPSWGNAGGSNDGESKSAWNSSAAPTTQTGGWGAAKKDEDTATADGWGAVKKDGNTSTTGGWAAAKKDESTTTAGGWGAPATQSGGSSWGNQADQGSGWGNKQAADGGNKDDGGSGWGSKSNDGGFSWSKPADGGGSSGSKQDGSSGGGGGNACFKCGETGHFSRECPQGGGGSSGSKNCFKCGEAGHMSRECPKGGGGGGGNACFKCGETGHMSRECPQGGGGGGGGDRSCYKCGESGHLSRECPKSGGGNACFKCGEEGHMSRECPQGGGGKSCYKCGEVGHMSRECPQGGGGGGGGGRSCYKCGESGHMSRECPQGGGGGGSRNCFKCGESGHMSRECPQGGGGGGGNRGCFKCGDSGHMSRECPQGGGGGGSRNCFKCGESGHMSRECPQGGGGDRGVCLGGGGGVGCCGGCGVWRSGGGGGGWSSGGGAGGWGSERASDAAGKKDDGQSSGWSSGNQTGGGWGGTNASDTTEKKDDAQGSGWGSGGDRSAGKKQGWGSGGSDVGGVGWGSSKESDADGKKDDAEGSGWKKSGW